MFRRGKQDSGSVRLKGIQLSGVNWKHAFGWTADGERNPNALASKESADTALVARVAAAIDGPFYWRQAAGQDADPAGAKKAAVHYIREGERLGFRPHPLFHPAFYLDRNVDVAQSGKNAFAHYLMYGMGEGRLPHPLIVKGDLLRQPGDLDRPPREAITPLFDSGHYLEMSEDVARAGADPLWHYLRWGWVESRPFHPLFDAQFYLTQLKSEAPLEPLTHYVMEGARGGLDPHPLFLAEQDVVAGLSGSETPLERYVSDPLAYGDPHPLFGQAHYLSQLASSAAAPVDSLGGETPLAHYLRLGWREGLSPHPLFDPQAYQDWVGRELDEAPLLHFLRQCRANGDPAATAFHKPNCRFNRSNRVSPKLRDRLEETFDPTFYMRQNPDLGLLSKDNGDVERNSTDALRHFMLYGAAEGRDPSPSFRTDIYLRLAPEARADRDGPYYHFLRLPPAEQSRRLAEMAQWRGPTSRAPNFNRYGVANGVFVITHHTDRSGAPLIALNIVRALAREYRLPVVSIMLNATGPLRSEFERDSVETIDFHEVLGANDDNPKLAWGDVADRLSRRGIANGICNSLLSSQALEHLTGRNLRCVSLVHELPVAITGYGWGRHAENTVNFSSCVVFPSQFVRDRFNSEFGQPNGTTRIMGQPSNLDPGACQAAATPGKSRRLRAALGLAEEDFVVLSVGGGDFRKGVDLYLQTVCAALERAGEEGRRLSFLWAGDVPNHVGVWVRHDLERRGWADRVHLAGVQHDTIADYYAVADMFFLPSREDPFPTVVIEALQAGLPVVGFEDSGGVSEQIGEGAGWLVPYGDWSKAADLLVELRSTDLGQMRAAALARGQSFVTPEHYAADLLNLLQFGLTRAERQQNRPRTALVGVGVPAYNCARYLEERLWSIFEQTLAPADIFMIDDASPDATVEVMHRLKAFAPSPCRIVENRENSRSPFLQWKQCLEALDTPYAWIAESDDGARIRFLDRLVGRLGEDKDITLAYARSATMDAWSRECDTGHDAHLESVAPLKRWARNYVRSGREEIAEVLAFENTIPNVSACLVDRKAAVAAVETAQNFRTCGDWVFYLELLHQGRVAYHAEVLNLHRRHETGIINRFEPEPIFHVERAAAHLLALRSGGLDLEAARRMIEREDREFERLMRPVRPEAGRSWLDVMQRRLVDDASGDAPHGAKNVLVILPDLHVGGGQMCGIRLANALAERHYVWVYVVDHSDGDGDLSGKLDARVGLLPEMDFEQLAGVVGIVGIDLISSHVWWSDKLAFGLKKRRPGTRWLMTMHGCYERILQEPRIDPWFSDNVAELLDTADAIAYIADKNLKVFERFVITPAPGRVRKVYNGIAPPRSLPTVIAGKLAADGAARSFVLVGRGIEEKGWREAAEALRQVNGRLAADGRAPVELSFVGKGDFLSEVQRDPQFADLPIRHVGVTDDVFGLLANADVGLLPSFFPQESLANSVVEYLYAGLPAIVTDIGELPAMIASPDGDAGMVIGFKDGRADVEALADAMYLYASDAETFRMHMRRTQAAAGKFDMGAMIRAYGELVGLELLIERSH
jgi:glycosyltransferase involved in cell wall biosynthesis